MPLAGIGPFVFALGGYAAVDVDCNIRAQRAEVVKQFRKRDLKRIYEPGCGGATTLGVCRQQFPDAELIGGDLSPALLRGGHFMSEMLGLNITFRQEDCTKVAERDNSDLIVMGVRGRNPFDLAIFGSTANQVVRRARCPVLTYRP